MYARPYQAHGTFLLATTRQRVKPSFGIVNMFGARLRRVLSRRVAPIARARWTARCILAWHLLSAKSAAVMGRPGNVVGSHMQAAD